MPRTKPDSPLKHPTAPEMCASCIFRTDGKQVELRPGALEEIQTYLLQGVPHRCHTPAINGNEEIQLACRGGRDYQLQCWYRMGFVAEPTDEALEARMKELGL